MSRRRQRKVDTPLAWPGVDATGQVIPAARPGYWSTHPDRREFSERDRAWFAQHPGTDLHLREFYDGERPDDLSDAACGFRHCMLVRLVMDHVGGVSCIVQDVVHVGPVSRRAEGGDVA